MHSKLYQNSREQRGPILKRHLYKRFWIEKSNWWIERTEISMISTIIVLNTNKKTIDSEEIMTKTWWDWVIAPQNKPLTSNILSVKPQNTLLRTKELIMSI